MHSVQSFAGPGGVLNPQWATPIVASPIPHPTLCSFTDLDIHDPLPVPLTLGIGPRTVFGPATPGKADK
jgi:hypothetical protein